MRKHDVRLEDVCVDSALIGKQGKSAEWIALFQIEDAARQPDNGDGRVPLYRALQDMINKHRKRQEARELAG